MAFLPKLSPQSFSSLNCKTHVHLNKKSHPSVFDSFTLNSSNLLLSGLSCPTGSALVCHVKPFFPDYWEVWLSQEMTCSTPWGWRSAASGVGVRRKMFQIPNPPRGAVHCGFGKTSFIHSTDLIELLLLWCANENVCVFECVYVYVHWLWLNMFCGINSDHGWASFLCNQTNWLTSRVRIWTEFLLWLPLCWVLSTCQPGAEKWEARARSNRRKNSSSGSSPSILLSRQISSQRRRGHTDDHRTEPLSAQTGRALQLCWVQHHASYPEPPQMAATKMTGPPKAAPQPR